MSREPRDTAPRCWVLFLFCVSDDFLHLGFSDRTLLHIAEKLYKRNAPLNGRVVHTNVWLKILQNLGQLANLQESATGNQFGMDSLRNSEGNLWKNVQRGTRWTNCIFCTVVCMTWDSTVAATLEAFVRAVLVFECSKKMVSECQDQDSNYGLPYEIGYVFVNDGRGGLRKRVSS